MEKVKPTNIIIFIGAISLFVGIFNLPYGYYGFLRGIISMISVYGIFTKYKTSKIMVVMLLISLLFFNPILPIHLNKATWRIIDLIFSLIFLYISYTPIGYKK